MKWLSNLISYGIDGREEIKVLQRQVKNLEEIIRCQTELLEADTRMLADYKKLVDQLNAMLKVHELGAKR